MSFDLYVQAFDDGNPAGIPQAFIRQVFGSHLTEVEPDYWTLTFNQNDACSVFPTINDDSTDLVHGLSIGNPCDNPVLWECLAGLLSFGNTILYFPGGSGPLALHELVTSHVPQSLGKPILVSGGQDIRQIVLAA